MFAHLHVHSHYSLLRSSSSINQIVSKASDMGMSAIALTDYGNMYGAVEFYFAAQKKGIKPIIGLEVFLEGSFVKSSSDSYNLVLLAKDYKGYQTLSRISSYGLKENLKNGVPKVSLEYLKENSENVIALTGGHTGVLVQSYLNHGDENTVSLITELKDIFGEDLYIEICRQGLKHENEVIPFSRKLAKDLNLKVVPANDTRFSNYDDLVAHNVLVGIGEGKTLTEVEASTSVNGEFYLKSEQKMLETLGEEISTEGLSSLKEIVDKCSVEFHLTDAEGKPIYHLPSFPTKDNRPDKEEIREVSFEGLEKRFKEIEIVQGKTLSDEEKAVYVERLEYELSVIDSMGFNGYFLIVQDFIKWTKESDIPVGPGRGSGAGSLVAFSLEITDLDPIPYALIFERFLNPERVSMPDFDIDFCQDRRGEVIDYVTETYGQQSVSQIITYGKLQTRAALRDVGRVLGFNFQEINEIAKLIPDTLGISLQESLDTEPRLQEMMDENPQVNKLITLALKIEGLVRHAGIHAAGVIIADGDLVAHAPVTSGSDGENVVQFDMKNSEKIGLIKFDFLGLKTLTHIKKAFDYIEKTKGKKLKPLDVSLSDPGIYELMSKGDTDGVFQFEGEGITDLTIKAKPESFTDIVALNALYRPGPMEMIPDYLKRKSGKKKVEYLFPELEEILKETYGIIVYQEHVQLIASKIASYSLGEADMLRRAMGKKIAEEMEKQKDRFLKGARENNFDTKKSEKLFDLMAEFAKYGFNKSHAAAYCVITAQTAWLKHYYPVEFFSALLSTEITNTDNVVRYIKDAKKHDIEIVPPHVNSSFYDFNTDGQKIFFSLGAIKGVGASVVDAIVEARNNLPDKKFQSLDQFFEEVNTAKINKKSLESLVKAGAFDGFGYNRSELFSGARQFLEAAETQRKEKEIGQYNLFDQSDDSSGFDVQIDKKEEWANRAMLQLEKEVLGFYLSSHPLDGFSTLRKTFNSVSVASLGEDDHKKPVTIFGLIPKTKEFITKKGTRMAFGQAEDEDGSLELVIFPDVFKEVEGLLTEEKPLLITGTFETSEGRGGKILVESITNPAERLKKTKKVTIKAGVLNSAEIDGFIDFARSKSGSTKVSLDLEVTDLKKRVNFELLDPEGIEFDFEFLESVGKIFSGYDGLDLGV